MPICSFEKEKKSHWNNVDFFQRVNYYVDWLMILCSLKCHHFPRHSIICMAISVIGTLKFWGHPLLSEPTKNKPVNWHFARPGWYQVRMTINITENLTLTLLEPSLKWKNKFKTLWPWIRNKKIKTNCVSFTNLEVFHDNWY